jgi:hypothetical protein
LPGKRNLDAFQAIWEHVNGRSLVYPKPRYDKPIFVNPENFAWIPVDGETGVAEKFVGSFTERRTSTRFVRIDPGAAYAVDGKRDIYFVLSGKGRVADKPLRKLTTVWLDDGDRVRFEATETVEMVNLRLPDLSGLKADQQPLTAVAAE